MADTGSADTRSIHTGSADTRSIHTGSADTGSIHTGSVDTGSADTGSAAGWSTGLDPAQSAAVDYDGPALLIVAGAGTGKTRTLVARLARLVESGVAPDRILLVTFTRRAAEEMVRRLGPLVGADASRRVHAGTFHAVAHRLLRQNGARLGLGSGFSVLHSGDAADLMQLARLVVTAAEAEPARRRLPRKDTLLDIYSRLVNARQPLSEVLPRSYQWVQHHEELIRSIFNEYTARKRRQRLLDFDDLMLYWQAAAADQILGPVLADAYDHVFVDEYQDTNLIQGEIVRLLRRDGRAVTVAGDDGQAIYAFRAATVRNMLEFPSHFPGAAVVTLERNYRATQPILDVANAVLAGATEGYPRRLWTSERGGPRPVLVTCPDANAQAAAVADVVLEYHDSGVALQEQVVLFRSAHHSDLLEVELRRRHVPFVKYGGLRFLEAAHVRDLLAALRVLDNRRDELAWYRLLQLVDGIGPVAARRILGSLGLDDPGSDPLTRFVGADLSLPARSREAVAPLQQALNDCRPDTVPPSVQIDRLRQGLEPLMRHRYVNAEVRLRDLDALSRLASSYVSRAQAVAELTLDPPSSTGDLAGPPGLDDDYLILSTVHSAKGGEWRVVHLIHAADGMFPSDMATGDADGVEEERRLFYVALTRARQHLHIYAPLRFHHRGRTGWGDSHSYAQRTRFLPPSLDRLLDHRAVRAADADTALPEPSVGLPTAVDQVLRGLW